jgi:hypothetical protein
MTIQLVHLPTRDLYLAEMNIKANERWKCEMWRMQILKMLTHYARRVYPKVSGLIAWSEICKRYSSLPLVAVV